MVKNKDKRIICHNKQENTVSKLRRLIDLNEGREKEMKEFCMENGLPEQTWYRIRRNDQRITSLQKGLFKNMVKTLNLKTDPSLNIKHYG